MIFILTGCAVENNFSDVVVLNELLAKSSETADWFEVFNPGPEPLNLKNWAVVDKYDIKVPWVLPEVIVLPETYLVIWADDKDTDEDGLHTDFKLSKEGEGLYLIDPEGEVVDTVVFPELERDQSYARIPDGTGDWTLWDRPTMGALNQ